jgi:uncharacterized protein (TIGR03085 family)
MAKTSIARAERAALCDLFDVVGPDAPTLCEGWATRDLAAHLVVREGRPDLAAGMFVPFLAGRLESSQRAIAARPWAGLVDTVRQGPPVWNPMRLAAVDELMNLVEFVVHHEDVLRGDGAPGPRRDLDARTERAIWGALRRTAPLMFRRSNVAVTLEAPGYGTAIGHKGTDPVRITGEPLELLLTAYGRGAAAKVSYAGDPDAIATLKTTRLGLA